MKTWTCWGLGFGGMQVWGRGTLFFTSFSCQYCLIFLIKCYILFWQFYFYCMFSITIYSPHFLKILFIFWEGEGREKERERNIDVQEKRLSVAPHMPPTGDLVRNPGMHPDQESNRQPFGSQTGAQSTDLHQPGHHLSPFYFPSPSQSPLCCPCDNFQLKCKKY